VPLQVSTPFVVVQTGAAAEAVGAITTERDATSTAAPSDAIDFLTVVIFI
jgi:hypothetical protein